jgi:hypothetical protein
VAFVCLCLRAGEFNTEKLKSMGKAPMSEETWRAFLGNRSDQPPTIILICFLWCLLCRVLVSH